MKSFTILSIFFILCILLNCTYASDVKILTDQTFDHDVQPQAGTSGDWFVEFYAPWCGHCQRLSPIWDQVATELKQEVNIAKVDVTTNEALGRRFHIRGFPTLKFIRHGKVYDYQGDRSFESLVEFARSGYANVEGAPAPGIPTLMSMIQDEAIEVFQQLKQIAVGYPAAAVSFFAIGLLFGVTLTLVLVTLTGGSNQSTYPPVSRPTRPQAAIPASATFVESSTTSTENNNSSEKGFEPSQASLRKRAPRVD